MKVLTKTATLIVFFFTLLLVINPAVGDTVISQSGSNKELSWRQLGANGQATSLLVIRQDGLAPHHADIVQGGNIPQYTITVIQHGDEAGNSAIARQSVVNPTSSYIAINQDGTSLVADIRSNGDPSIHDLHNDIQVFQSGVASELEIDSDDSSGDAISITQSGDAHKVLLDSEFSTLVSHTIVQSDVEANATIRVYESLGTVSNVVQAGRQNTFRLNAYNDYRSDLSSTQDGFGNRASVRLRDANSNSGGTQINLSQSGVANVSRINISGDSGSTAAVHQTDDNNRSQLIFEETSSVASTVDQSEQGDANVASLRARFSEGSSLSLDQSGDDNSSVVLLSRDTNGTGSSSQSGSGNISAVRLLRSAGSEIGLVQNGEQNIGFAEIGAGNQSSVSIAQAGLGNEGTVLMARDHRSVVSVQQLSGRNDVDITISDASDVNVDINQASSFNVASLLSEGDSDVTLSIEQSGGNPAPSGAVVSVESYQATGSLLDIKQLSGSLQENASVSLVRDTDSVLTVRQGGTSNNSSGAFQNTEAVVVSVAQYGLRNNADLSFHRARGTAATVRQQGIDGIVTVALDDHDYLSVVEINQDGYAGRAHVSAVSSALLAVEINQDETVLNESHVPASVGAHVQIEDSARTALTINQSDSRNSARVNLHGDSNSSILISQSDDSNIVDLSLDSSDVVVAIDQGLPGDQNQVSMSLTDVDFSVDVSQSGNGNTVSIHGSDVDDGLVRISQLSFGQPHTVNLMVENLDSPEFVVEQWGFNNGVSIAAANVANVRATIMQGNYDNIAELYYSAGSDGESVIIDQSNCVSCTVIERRPL